MYDEDNGDSITIEKMCVITGYMRRFIEEGMGLFILLALQMVFRLKMEKVSVI